MWSGPRNISTAMMRSFGNRADCAVVDEPLYGPYLALTGKDHPGADEVIAAQGGDWRAVVNSLGGPIPAGRSLYYQKHMTHHMLPQIDLEWLHGLTHCFLIRDPAEVLASYSVRRSDFDASDLGFEQQLRLFQHVCNTSGRIPVVIDGNHVLADPERALRRLCGALAIDFDPAMLHWQAGPRASDGVWGKYWYDRVWDSTGFTPRRSKSAVLNEAQRELAEQCRPAYETLYRHRLKL